MVLKMKYRLPLFFQLTRFGIVGVTAALVHFSMVVLLVEVCGFLPLIANGFAFCVSFPVSYWGHRLWTFYDTRQKHAIALPRLLLVSTLAFAANESLFFLFMQQFALPYPVALFLVLSILPLLVFLANKLWVFESLQ